jgi:predicted dienelactone hydrolase
MKTRAINNLPLRALIRCALLLGMSLFIAVGISAPAASAQGAAPTVTGQSSRPVLPPPTGHQRVGVVPLHLVDRTRPDPWVPEQSVRELMVSLWYPAQRIHHYPRAAWLPPAAWSRFTQNLGVTPDVLQVPLTHGAVGAPVDPQRGGRPVVLYSPGAGGYRDGATVLVEELVSRGYIVVTIDHTHDSGVVEFPGGRLETSAIPEPTPQVIEQAVAVRAADIRFVLDTLTALNAGINPDAEQSALPAGLRGALRLSSVGMFGHSRGGAAAAAAMLQDPRIKVGVNLDGTLFGPVVNAGLNRPFMLIASQDHGRNDDQTWDTFWTNLHGWRLDLQLTGSGHDSFTDFQVMVPQAAGVLGIPPEAVQESIGTINPERSITNQRAYLTAFFDLHLRGCHSHLLDHPSPRFPEMEFVP